MADFNSSLPVRTQNNGDVVSFIADGTTPTQLLAVAADGSIKVTQNTTPWVTKDQADGPVTPGAVASFSTLIGGQFNTALPTLTNGQQAALQTDSSGRLLVVANATLTYDTNYGVVGANTLRGAAQIGNATGAADFNFGAAGAQTLRVAALLGNSTGAADFNYGTVGAQTIRVASQVGNATGANSATNPLFVTLSDVAGTSVDNYQTSAAVAANASVNLDYTVTAAKTFYTRQIQSTASGKIKMVAAYETGVATGVFNTFWVGFNSTAEPNILIPVPTQKTQIAGARIRITITNTDKAAMDVYSTLSGTEQ